VKNQSHTITAEVDIPDTANGAIIAQAERFGGWSLYLNGRQADLHYNWLGLQRYTLPPSKHCCREATIRSSSPMTGWPRQGRRGYAPCQWEECPPPAGSSNPVLRIPADEGAENVGADGALPSRRLTRCRLSSLEKSRR